VDCSITSGRLAAGGSSARASHHGPLQPAGARTVQQSGAQAFVRSGGSGQGDREQASERIGNA